MANYNVKTTLTLNDKMSKGLNNILKPLQQINAQLGQMSGFGTVAKHIGDDFLDLAAGAELANESVKKMAGSLRSMPTGVTSTMTPLTKLSGGGGGGAPAAPKMGGGAGLEPSKGVMDSLKGGYQRLVDYSAQLDQNTIGFVRQLRYSMLNTYIIVQGLKSVGRLVAGIAEGFDAHSNALARLNLANSMLNDGLYTTRELQEEVYQSARRSRMAYGDMVDFVSDMTLQAGHAFKNQKEILHFSELIQKSFKASGTSVQSQVAGLYQLKQALASNRLQGDEFVSIIENMPQFTDMLRDSLGLTHEELKKLSSEGGITAEVMKQAVFDSEEMIEQMFEAMPITFGDTMVEFGNIWDKAMWEAKEKANTLLNSAMGQEIVEKLSGKLERLGKIISRMMDYIPRIVETFSKFVNLTKDNSGILLMAIGTVILQKALLEGVNSMIKLVTATSGLGATGWVLWGVAAAIMLWIHSLIEAGYSVQGVVTAVMNKINDLYNFFLPIINIIAFAIGIVISIIQDVIAHIDAYAATLGMLAMAWLIVKMVSDFANMSMMMKIMMVIGIVLALILIVSKIAPAVGSAVGKAIGFFMALGNVVIAVGTLIGAIFEFVKAIIISNIADAIGGAIIKFGELVDKVQEAANAIGQMMVDGMNIAIGGVNSLINAINKIPGVELGGLAEFAEYTGIDGVGGDIISFGEGIKAAGAAGVLSAGVNLGNATEGLQNALDGFGDTIDEWGAKGEEFGQGVTDFLTSGTDKILGFVPNLSTPSLDGLNIENIPGLGGDDIDGADSPDGGGGGGGRGGGGGKPNIGTVDKVNEVDLSDSTMKLLQAMYERDLFQRFVNIDSSMQFSFVGVDREEDDAEDIAANVDRMVTERLANLLIT